MNCPKCNAAMEQVTVEDIAVDRCTLCKGLWFDANEQNRLRQVAGSEAIDIGDRTTGRILNQEGDIACPRCGVKMLRLADPRQHHLWYESCPVCHGVFFDAGEFKDFKHRTVADLLRDWRTPERP